jgi:hypothetical protein
MAYIFRLHANNNAGALPRGNPNHDPAHKVRRIFDLINKVFKEKYAAARDLTVDESITICFRGEGVGVGKYCE